jgi:hypothetical protein
MSFLAPSVLWALGLLAIPIIIHLFQLRRFKKVFFSDIRFLEAIQQQTKNRQQLKHLLVLLMRLLAVTAMVLAFAQPYIPKGTATIPFDAPVYIFLDNSPSMEADGPKGNLFNNGKEKVLEILAVFGEQHPYKLISNDQPRPDRDFLDAPTLKRTLAQLQPTGASRTFAEILKAVASDAQSAQSARFFYISDFQEASVDSVAMESVAGLQVTLVPLMDVQEIANLSIDSVWFNNPILQPGFEQELTVAITNHSTTAQQTTNLQLNLNGVLRGVQKVVVPAAAETQVKLRFTPNETGLIQGTVTIEDSPIRFDDTYHFSINISNSRVAYHLYDGKPNEKIARILTDPFTQYEAAPLQKINFTTLENADLLVLEGLNEYTSGLVGALATALSAGKNLLIIPAADYQPGQYAALENLLGIQLGERQTDSARTRTLHFADPFFSGVFQETNENVLLPTFKQYFALKGRIKPLLTLPNGLPVAGRIDLGGQAIVLAVPLLANWSNLEQHPILLPLAYQGLIYREVQINIAHAIGTLGANTFTIPQFNPDFPVLLRNVETQEESIPPKQQFGNRHQLFAGEVVHQPGFYEVVHNTNVVGLMAFNIAKAESVTRYVAPESLEKTLAANGWQLGLPTKQLGGNLTQALLENEKGRPLWPFFIAAAVAFLLFESLIIRWKQT